VSDFVQELFTSRSNYADGNTRIGQLDRLWYDSITNTVRISDGITPGGIIVSGGGTGISGYSGAAGASGYSGAAFVGSSGYSGEIGASGYSGAMGTSGYSGATGIDGISGYSGLVGYSGYSGSVGIDGASGYSGASGSTGIDGISGYSGMPGANGTSGYSGLSGTTGSDGISGYSGATGASGYSGLDGTIGVSGFSGFSGLNGSGVSNWILVVSDYTASNGARIIANTQSGSFTIYLPASPNLGDYVQITDGWDFAVNNCIVNPNGSTIETLADNVALDLKGVTFEFIYSGTTWQVTGTTGARGQSGYSGISGYSGAALTPWTVINSNYTATNYDR
jgi:hypothetical protein